MYKLGCYVSENDILSSLSVMIVYFAIHQVIWNICLCAITQQAGRKSRKSERNKRLGESVARPAASPLPVNPGVPHGHTPSSSSLPPGAGGRNKETLPVSPRAASWGKSLKKHLLEEK